MHGVSCGSDVRRGAGSCIVHHYVPRGLLLSSEHRDDRVRRGHVQHNYRREFSDDVLVVHGCSREFLPCGEHFCVGRDVPERLLLCGRHSGSCPRVVRQWIGNPCGLCSSSGLNFFHRLVCHCELRCWLLLHGRHRAAAVPGRKVC
jgi:hypothetical protein